MGHPVNREVFDSWVSDIGSMINAGGKLKSPLTVDTITTFVEEVTRGAKKGRVKSMEHLCAFFARVAFVTPEAIPLVYDAFARSWLGLPKDALPKQGVDASVVQLLNEISPMPARVAQSYWSIIHDIGATMSPSEITSRVAALGGDLPASFHERAEAFACNHPGVTEAHRRPIPAPLTKEVLAALPVGSLGYDFYRLIIDNQFDLEVLDREAIGLQNLPPGLRYLNTRILQMHDIWHLVGGYTTLALHENSISGFQLAQFGHNYSANYLATVAMASRVKFRAGLKVLLQVMAEGWLHGRQTCSFMDIEWEREWHLPISEIRRLHGITPYRGIYPADLIEKYVRKLEHPVIKAAVAAWGALNKAYRRFVPA